MADSITSLETRLTSSDASTTDMRDLVVSLLESVVVVPSGAEFDSGRGAFQPVLYPRGDVQMMAVFSTFERIGDSIKSIAPYAATMSGLDVIRRLAPGVGLVVNPGSQEGFEILPEAIELIRVSAPKP